MQCLVGAGAPWQRAAGVGNKSDTAPVRLPGAALSRPGSFPPMRELSQERKQSETNMYNHAYPVLLGTRDVIAAWLVCLAVGVAAFVSPGLFPEPAREAQAALRGAAPSISRTQLC